MEDGASALEWFDLSSDSDEGMIVASITHSEATTGAAAIGETRIGSDFEDSAGGLNIGSIRPGGDDSSIASGNDATSVSAARRVRHQASGFSTAILAQSARIGRHRFMTVLTTDASTKSALEASGGEP